MAKNELQVIDQFDIGAYGMETLIRLIKTRVDYDLDIMRKQLFDAETELRERDLKGRPWYSFKSTDKLHLNVLKLQEVIRLKEKWLSEWSAKATKTLNEVKEKHDLIQLPDLSLDPAVKALGIKGFLVIQEVIFYPVYKLLEGYPEDLSEIDAKGAAGAVAKAISWPESMGKDIYSDTHKFFRKAAGFWKNVVGWTLGGTLVAAATAGLAAPLIATTAGGLMGLSGAAATSAGLALFGGGSIAAGGAGMTGGMLILVGGGGLLGAGAGMGAANLIKKSNKESMVVTCAKVLNYSKFLNAEAKKQQSPESTQASGYLKDLRGNFLSSKHEIERELLLSHSALSKKAIKHGLDQIKILELTFEEMLDSY